ncbi:hypothetical protein SAMN06265182_0979 [Persephonella hydrogeniphila]|uniref:Uncharacterized protein n=1 Tax=Persephonella hydrogeniphila TaxID=198703 RepID=A0A285NJ77_9AQUI|nr:hypothetical protein [Persephonella hydrogeniphila]SNZ07711.1 hypothetical protein SAMN06265182_0979 [Persephonella hydrogeniphila]
MFEVFVFSFITALMITGFFILFVKISGIEKLLLETRKEKDE